MGEDATGREPVRWASARARGVLAATVIGSGMAMLDGTVVNVALPRIGAELAVGVAGLQWILNGYLLALASLILLAGSLGDRYGRRRTFRFGVIWFGVCSLLCGLAPNIELLVAARVLQGVGAALLTPGSLAILQTSFGERDRARAIGAWSGLSGITTAVGPLVGGLLVQVWSWRLAFLVNLPLAALCVWLTSRHVPESWAGDGSGKLDVVGAVLGTVGLAGITAALVTAADAGPVLVAALAAVGVAALVAFVVRQVRTDRPLVPPALFADRTFCLANGLTLLVYAALGGVLLLLVLQLQIAMHYSPTAAGIAGLPITVLMLVLSAQSGRWAQRIGPRWQLVIGPLLIAGGMLLLRRAVPGADYATGVLPGLVLFGLGLATVVAPVTATALAAAPDEQAGVASGVNNAVARTGSLLAVSVLPLLAGLGGTRYADPVALTEGWRLALVICAAAAALGGLLGLGVDNAVLGRAPAKPRTEPRPGATAPHPGECVYCGVEGPPTHVRPFAGPRPG